jgi:membrane protein YqaA with SNARE-associated domain
MLRRAYHWVLNYAEHPYALWALIAVSFAESSFFPIPPDPLYIAMLIANRERAWRLAIVCTLSSVIGGIAGYYIGYGLYESIGKMIIDSYGLGETFTRLQHDFNEWGFWIVAGKGLTPIPYKIVTIASGVAGLHMTTFIVASLIARGFRFFSLAGVVLFCGPGLRDYLEKNIGWLTTLTVGVLVLGFVVIKYIDNIRLFCSQLCP